MATSVRAVERALEILTCFTPQNRVLSLTQISEQVGMHKSTTHRLLSTLEQMQFVRRSPKTGLYQLGFRLVELSSIALKEIGIQQITPYLQKLVEQCGETVDLAVLDGSSVIYLQVIESPQRVKIAASVGQRLPSYSTASGKALLAYLPEAVLVKLLSNNLKTYTARTITNYGDLLKSLQKTRELGYAISEEEYENDINAVAAPILTDECVPLAAIAIAGPSYRLSRDRMLELGELVKTTVKCITRELGNGDMFESLIEKAAVGIVEKP